MTEAKTAPKKKPATKKPAAHPKYQDMIVTAITVLKERNGSSRQAISKYIKANNKVGDNSDVHLKMALKRGVASGLLRQVKGTGASGSFKVVATKVEKPKKQVVKKAPTKKPASSSSSKKPATKKPAAGRKTTKTTTPKKKKPTTKKSSSAKKPKSATKKPVAKKPKAKKTPKKGGKKTKK